MGDNVMEKADHCLCVVGNIGKDEVECKKDRKKGMVHTSWGM